MFSIFKLKQRKEQRLMKEKEDLLQATFLEKYPCTLDIFDDAVDYNPYLDDEEKELLRKQKSYFEKYPLDDYEDIIKKVLVLKINFQETKEIQTLMITNETSITSFIKREDERYLHILKHEMVHYLNKNFSYTYTRILNEGFTNLLSMDIYGLKLSQQSYLYWTIFTMMISEIMGKDGLVKKYQTASEEDSVKTKLMDILGEKGVLKLFYNVCQVEVLEYQMWSILEEAKVWQNFRISHQEEYVDYYLLVQEMKKEILEQIDTLYHNKFGVPMNTNEKMKIYKNYLMSNVYELKGTTSDYINYGLLKNVNNQKVYTK